MHKDYLNRLEALHLDCFRMGGLQERFTNFSEFYMDHGDEFIKRLKLELDP